MDKRNFYKGQSVKAEQLNKLQDYSDRGQANLIASLLGYGVVNGFEISIIEGHIVGVTAGLAFNLAGERLVLAEGQQVNLAQYIPNVGEKTIKLGIIQDFIKTDPATDSMGNAEYTKWTPTVKFVTGETLGTGTFELAEIKINPVSIVEIKATSANFTTLQKQTDTVSNNKKMIDKKVTDLTTTVTENKSAIENTVTNNKSAIDGRVNTLSSTVATNKTDITALKNKTNDPTFSNRILSLINSSPFVWAIRSLAYPIKSTYTQYPNDRGVFDKTETPKALFGGDWELLFSNEGVFFRTEGGLSEDPTIPIGGGTGINRINGVQGDAIKNMTGQIRTTGRKGLFDVSTGSFSLSGNIDNNSNANLSTFSGSPNVDLNSYGSVKTALENRPTNRLIKIWQRIG